MRTVQVKRTADGDEKPDSAEVASIKAEVAALSSEDAVRAIVHASGLDADALALAIICDDEVLDPCHSASNAALVLQIDEIKKEDKSVWSPSAAVMLFGIVVNSEVLQTDETAESDCIDALELVLTRMNEDGTYGLREDAEDEDAESSNDEVTDDEPGSMWDVLNDDATLWVEENNLVLRLLGEAVDPAPDWFLSVAKAKKNELRALFTA